RSSNEKGTKKMNWKPTAKRWSLAIALLALGALILAGCGGGGSSTGSESTTASSNSESSGAKGKGGGPGGFDISEEQRACLKEKGVELPEFKGGEGGPPQGGEGGEPPEGLEPPAGGEMPEGGESSGGAPPAGAGGPGGEGFTEMKQAFEECGVETPELDGGPAGEASAPVKSAVFRRQVRRYAACVRKNGYDLGEPNFSGEGPVFKEAESESAAFKQASAKCQSLLGSPRAGRGSARRT
ncbi:MAG: hypothetical protein J0H06_16915, partial [Actinobacteria bacterium]|nr:hypothetical protein [Actinomycetota bacterium]